MTNNQSQIGALRITTANTDDRKLLAALTVDLKGKMFGDKGYYISKEVMQQLWRRGLHLITGHFGKPLSPGRKARLPIDALPIAGFS